MFPGKRLPFTHSDLETSPTTGESPGMETAGSSQDLGPERGKGRMTYTQTRAGCLFTGMALLDGKAICVG